jgi:alkaline phosphatase D
MGFDKLSILASVTAAHAQRPIQIDATGDMVGLAGSATSFGLNGIGLRSVARYGGIADSRPAGGYSGLMLPRRTTTRRALLTGATASFVASGSGRARAAAGYPFTLGVASGNPAPDGVVLWTRLAPEPLSPDPERPGGMPPLVVPVRWEIADDPAMRRVVQSGDADAEPEFAHSVHIECSELEPGRDYWYRFTAAGEASLTGHTRTAPALGAPLGRLRFGFCSCANYEWGYFSAYRHLAAEAPDLVLFLGDYIYEYASRSDKRVRDHSDGVEATDLRTYRNRHAQYKTDPDLQLLHAAAPCLATWDDHEVQNDYADRWSQDYADPTAFLARRAAAYRAFWEHMPLPRSAMPKGPDATIYGRFDFGDLASFLVVDGRQYRSRPPAIRAPGAAASSSSTGHVPNASTRPAATSAWRRRRGSTSNFASLRQGGRRAGTYSRNSS